MASACGRFPRPWRVPAPFTRPALSSAQSNQLAEVLPKSGLVVSEKGNLGEVLCKPKVLPLKSVTLEKLEQMEVRRVRFLE